MSEPLISGTYPLNGVARESEVSTIHTVLDDTPHGGGHAQAQARVHAERRVLILEREIVREAGRTAAEVQVDRGRHHLRGEEVGHGALEGEVKSSAGSELAVRNKMIGWPTFSRSP